ncbi:MAG TPA: hypothetical protein PKD17_00690 [Cellvibrionaceae bacterium]|nr:hypothetical protein [Cellvibrionaceae bacterium]HMW70302.1 hypothetical protein [Cellvibrionaceae bacterium]HMY37877.1 hypothetical protein [Marinagarivorans sp.]HNG58359.1 hypothetical protein [Cellvibrionaceae bacterium]
MAQALKLFFSRHKVAQLAAAIAAVYPAFNSCAFMDFCCDGLEHLELMPRAQRLSAGLRRYLPADYEQAIEIIMLSLGPPLGAAENNGLEPFFYLPHVFFVRDYGLGHFAVSMAAQYELTQRFTAEFSLRPYFETHYAACMALLVRWAQDPSEHVRRLVSEGTRPRLPWAPKLARVIQQPQLTAPLLELLKDDPSLYVRRSVANHLNDVGKDHPDYMLQVLEGWAQDAPVPRQWLIKHALRSAVKRGNSRAIGVLGFAGADGVAVASVALTPAKPQLGQTLVLRAQLALAADAKDALDVLVDVKMDFPGINGRRQKVFKITSGRLAPGAALPLHKSISLQPMTTRTYYPGLFIFTLLVNGQPLPLIEVDIV